METSWENRTNRFGVQICTPTWALPDPTWPIPDPTWALPDLSLGSSRSQPGLFQSSAEIWKSPGGIWKSPGWCTNLYTKAVCFDSAYHRYDRYRRYHRCGFLHRGPAISIVSSIAPKPAATSYATLSEAEIIIQAELATSNTQSYTDRAKL